MRRMVRKQIVIDPEQERALEERARVTGVSQSALIREAIDRLLKDAAARDRKEAWEDLFRGIEESKAAGIRSQGPKLTREELHERPHFR